MLDLLGNDAFSCPAHFNYVLVCTIKERSDPPI